MVDHRSKVPWDIFSNTLGYKTLQLLERMNIRGEQLVVLYEDITGSDILDFLILVNDPTRRGELVERLNALMAQKFPDFEYVAENFSK